jgi:hypothetical protein
MTDTPHEKIAPNRKDQSPDALNTLNACANLGTVEARTELQTTASKGNCKLPTLTLEADKTGVAAVAHELRQTALFGLKSWVNPDAVLGALRSAHPTNATRFEGAFTTFQGGNLRTELNQKLGSSDFRTAIAILENHEQQKQTADALETALQPNRFKLKFGADAESALKILGQIKPNQRAEFEADFPKRVGIDTSLRSELSSRLGTDNAYRSAIAILENREEEKKNADQLEQALKSTGWWGLVSTPKLMVAESTLAAMNPKQLAQFENNFQKNEGVALRDELHKYLGKGSEYDAVVSMLDNPPPAQDAAQPNGQAPTDKPQGQSNIREWLGAFKKLNKTIGIPEIEDIDPRTVNEKEFKDSYAKEVVRLGQKYGFDLNQTREIASGVYAAEGGGWGTFFTTANMPKSLLHPSKEEERLNFRPSTSAVGYNQILKSSTVEIVKKHGADFSDRLHELSKEYPAGDPRAKALDAKSKMMGVITSLAKQDDPPNGFSKEGFAEAVQALNMDKNIGPLIQAQQMGNLFEWLTKRQEQPGKPTAPALRELLPQTAERLNEKVVAFDGLPIHQRVAAISKLVSLAQPSQKELETAVHLTDKLKSLKPGLSAKLALTAPEQQLLSVAMHRSDDLPPSDQTRMLATKLQGLKIGKLTADKIIPAVFEMGNLAGTGGANGMIRHPNESTSKHFTNAGLSGNAIARNKDGDKLLIDIYATIQENKKQNFTGNIEFRDAFEKIHRKSI